MNREVGLGSHSLFPSSLVLNKPHCKTPSKKKKCDGYTCITCGEFKRIWSLNLEREREREREMVLKVCDFGSENVCRGTLHELMLSTFSACHKLKESN